MTFIVAKIPAANANTAAAPRRPARAPTALEATLDAGSNRGIPFVRGDQPQVYFTNELDAIAEAKRLATLTPTVQYGVFRADRVFETTAPKVLEKKTNADGELVIVTTEE